MAEEINKKYPIDKEYLLSSLKDFDKYILSKEYGKIDESLPTGGITGQVLTKASDNDGDVAWTTIQNTDSGEIGKSAYDIAVDNGFEGTESEWLESLKGDIGEKGNDGKSIISITSDNTNNVIVTFSDGTIQNIGQLNVDVQADFLTSNGFGNLRYLNGKFQYFNNNTETWVDTSATPDNVAVIELTPQPMKFIIAMYDKKLMKCKLQWEEPEDTIIDGQVLCLVEKVIIRRKIGGAPEDIEDGVFVAEIKRKNFGGHAASWFIDDSLNPEIGSTYYYRAFPVSSTGVANIMEQNVASAEAREYTLYGFILDQNESDPASMITYIEDNAFFSPAHMDYGNDAFDYGDWTVENGAWFMDVKPCMLNYDGTVAYYLDPNDKTLKEDGTPSDIANADFDGNAMMEWPKIYWKITDNGDGTGKFLFSDKNIDGTFSVWSNIDENGNEIPHFYTAIYEGTVIDGKLRSLSGKTPLVKDTCPNVQYNLNSAHANNPSGMHIYETLVFCDYELITMLSVLISGTTDSQTAFGAGNNNSYYSTTSRGILNTGTMDKKGLFHGYQNGTSAVVVFGIENFFGNMWKICTGLMDDGSGTYKVKMTYGQSDGSTVDGYNATGEGYITTSVVLSKSQTEKYLSACKFDEHGIIPIEANGSSTTKYCDMVFLYASRSAPGCATVGGDSRGKDQVGLFSLNMKSSSGGTSTQSFGASISCKPLAQGGES